MFLYVLHRYSLMYWGGVKGSYHWSPDERLLLLTSVRKTVVEYGSSVLRYSLRCNCTPDVAVNRIRSFPSVFEGKVGYRLVGNVRVNEDFDRNVFTFRGTVGRGRVVLDLPVILGRGELFGDVVSEVRFHERFVRPLEGKYSYYDGREVQYFDSYEELLSHVVGEQDAPPVREYYGDEFLQLFPGSKSYFREYGKMTVFMVNGTNGIISGPGFEVTFLPSRDDDFRSVVGLVRERFGGLYGSVIVMRGEVVRGSYYVRDGRFYLKHDVRGGAVYSEEVLEAGEGFGAVAGMVGDKRSVLVFDGFAVVVLGDVGVVQKVPLRGLRRRFGTMYRLLYFAPHPGAFTTGVVGDVGLSVYMAIEGIGVE